MAEGKKIVVVCGGDSSEREVSLRSGAACAAGLERAGYNVEVVDHADMRVAMKRILDIAPDVVFNALHGPGGEDGRIQGFLDLAGIRYTHSGVTASAVAMDKALAKQLFALAGLRAPKGVLCRREELRNKPPFAPPFVVKPNDEGSSQGVEIVRSNADFESAAQTGERAGQVVLVEEFVSGRELTVTVLEDQALAVTELTTDGGFYDYEAKYTAGRTKHEVPAQLPEEVYNAALEQALVAHRVLGCRHVSRSDFRYDPEKTNDEWHGLYILETNTQPGMTELSLAPEQAQHVGIGFDELVQRLVELALLD